MSKTKIDKIRHDARVSIKANIETILLSELGNSAYPLNRQCPAQTESTKGGYRISIFSGLNDEEKVEAEAHELAHLLLKAKGLIEIHLSGGADEDFLALHIRDCTSHRFLIPLMAEHYGISSSLHLKILQETLPNISEKILECSSHRSLLYGIGLQLLDLDETTEGNQMQVQQALAENPEVGKSYKSGRKFLLYPSINLPKSEQHERINGYIESLGYSPSMVVTSE